LPQAPVNSRLFPDVFSTVALETACLVRKRAMHAMESLQATFGSTVTFQAPSLLIEGVRAKISRGMIRVINYRSQEVRFLQHDAMRR
jgi:hypothetical protein